MAVRKIRLIRDVEYSFGKIYEGTVFTVVNIGKDKTATVIIKGEAQLVFPKDSYEVVDDTEG